jgi:hydrogenase maturation factor
MKKLASLGKIHPDFFRRFIYPKLGRRDSTVAVKPQSGVDFGVIDLGDKVLVLSTDPFFIARELGMEKAAWFAVHIIASDVAVSGIAPRYLSIDLNLPPEMNEDELVRMWDAVHQECAKLKIAVVTGHTARYAGCAYPMVGGATMFGIDRREKLIVPRARVGDAVIVSKGPAIETTGLMAAYFPQYLEERYGRGFVRKAQDVYYQMSTVKDALAAAAAGGVTALHDATEGGLLGGLWEIASHSKVGMRIDLDRVLVQETVRKTCECFGIDPFISISEGTLLATARPSRADGVVRALKNAGIEASIVGEARPLKEGVRVCEGGRWRLLRHPLADPFWSTFEKYLALDRSAAGRD